MKFFKFVSIILLTVSVFACVSGNSGARGLQIEELPSAKTNISVFPQLGHSGIVVAYSPDGKTITSGSKDGTLKLWDVVSGREIRTFSGHEDDVSSIVYSPDNRIIVSGSEDNTVKLWNVEDGREIHTLDGHYRQVNSVAFSPDGKYIASGSIDGAIILWDATNGEEIHSLDHYYSSNFFLSSIAFSPDSKNIISVSATIKIWDILSGSGVELSAFTVTASAISAVYSPDGMYIACSYRDNTVKLWDTVTGNLIRTFSGHTDGVNSIAFSPNGKIIASCSNDGTLRIWDVSSSIEIQSIGQKISSFAFSPDGKFITAASETVKLFDTDSGNELMAFTGNSITTNSVHFNPDGKTIISGSTLWNITSGREIKRNAGRVFNPDGKIIARFSSGTISLIDVETGNEIKKITGDNTLGLSVFSTDGKTIASASYLGGTIKLWDIDSGRELRTIVNPSSTMCSSIEFSPDGKTILSGDINTSIKLWDVNTGREIRSFTGHSSAVTSVTFSPNGRIIASGSWDSSVKLWDVNTGREIRSLTGHTGRISAGVQSVAFSPDGKTIISGAADTTVKLWNVNSGKEIKTFTGHYSTVQSVTFSPDGKTIASASADGTTRLWDVATGKEIAQFISFSGSDSQLTAASRGLTVETETASSNIEGEWLSITPDGYYQASPRGDRFLNVRVNNTVSGIDSYRSVFYNPDVVQARLQGKPDPASKANVTIQQAANFLPPQVTIKSPSTFTTTNTATANLAVTVTDQNQSIKNIKIFVNGRAISKNELTAIKGSNLQAERISLTVTGNQKTVNFELPLTLDPGRNLIEVVAFNGYSESARLSPIEVTYNAPAGQQRQLPNLWVLAVGVNGYDNAGLRLGGMGNLRFAVADAKRLVESLKSQEGRRYAKVNSLIIGDGESVLPAAANIRQNLSFLEQAGERDVVLLFLAGHGLSAQDGKFFFLPKDAVVSGTSGNWRVDEKLAISGEEITAVLEGQGNRLLFIDACQSGGVDNNRMIRTMMETNAFVFAASQGNEVSYEDPRWGGGHGVFTYNILNALKGAPNALAEGNVSVRSMSGFVSLEVPKATQGFPQGQQNPKVYSLLFSDFPLAVIK